jgi:2-aminoadipate transaminase
MRSEIMTMNRSNDLMVGIQLDRSSEKPLYLQLASSIRDRILEGSFGDAQKLPSTRDASESLGVHRATVVEAYRHLREQGWVRSGVGSGTYVVRRGEGGPSDPSLPNSSFWSSRMGDLPRAESARALHAAPAGVIRLTSPTADPAGFPMPEFRAALEIVFEREGAGCLDYGPPDGYAPLRERIASRLSRQGVSVDPARVILVNGSQQGLELIMRLLVPQGRTLLIEEPTYNLALRAARALKLPVRGIPLDEEGLRLDALDRALDDVAAGMLYTMPVFQNPTGLTLSRDRRSRLLKTAAEHGLPIVEDHFDAELDYRGDAPPPLLAEGSPPNVVLLGTFSKILFPGLRVGWLVVPEPLIGPLSEMKVCADLSSGLLTQMALAEFCRMGALDDHLERIRKRNASRLQAMLAALDENMPKGSRWTRPSGGMTLWLWLPRGLDSETIADEALAGGVTVTPGTAFHSGGGGRDGLRLCYIRENEERIREGIRLLALTMREQMARTPSRDREGAAAPIL